MKVNRDQINRKSQGNIEANVSQSTFNIEKELRLLILKANQEDPVKSTSDFISRVKRSPIVKKENAKMRGSIKLAPEASFDSSANQLVQSNNGAMYRSFDMLRKKKNSQNKKEKSKKTVKGYYQKPSLLSNFTKYIGSDKAKEDKANENLANSSSIYSMNSNAYSITSRNIVDPNKKSYFQTKVNSICSQKSSENLGSAQRGSFKTVVASRKSTDDKLSFKKSMGEKLKPTAASTNLKEQVRKYEELPKTKNKNPSSHKTAIIDLSSLMSVEKSLLKATEKENKAESSKSPSKEVRENEIKELK